MSRIIVSILLSIGIFSHASESNSKKSSSQDLGAQQERIRKMDSLKLKADIQKDLDAERKGLDDLQKQLNATKRKMGMVEETTYSTIPNILAGGLSMYAGQQWRHNFETARIYGVLRGLKPSSPLYRALLNTPYYGATIAGTYLIGTGVGGLLRKYYTSNISIEKAQKYGNTSPKTWK